MIQVSDQFPNFRCQDQYQQWHTYESIAQGIVVVYFYPQDDTPGCTKQACLLRDQYQQWDEAHIKIYAVSPDSIDSHKEFQQKYKLPFILLSDHDHALSEACGIWGIQSFGNFTYEGVERCTFLLKDGDVIYQEKVIDIEQHWKDLWDKVQSHR